MKITLSQFIAYSSKTTTSSKMNAVRSTKMNDYSVMTDYWKPIRDGLHRTLNGQQDFDDLMATAQRASESRNKRKNHVMAVNKLQHFFEKKSYIYSPSTPAIWKSADENLVVNSSPEFVLQMNGQTLLVKVNYRVSKADEKLTKTNSAATLFLMEQSIYDDRPQDSIPAILNLQNSKLITADQLKKPSQDVVNAEAAMFVALWNIC